MLVEGAVGMLAGGFPEESWEPQQRPANTAEITPWDRIDVTPVSVWGYGVVTTGTVKLLPGSSG